MNDKKLFIVEFGEPTMPNFMNLRFGGPKPVYVVAKDYNEAANKALLYAEAKKMCLPKKSILDEDGSLRTPMDFDDEIKVAAVRLAADEIIW